MPSNQSNSCGILKEKNNMAMAHLLLKKNYIYYITVIILIGMMTSTTILVKQRKQKIIEIREQNQKIEYLKKINLLFNFKVIKTRETKPLNRPKSIKHKEITGFDYLFINYAAKIRWDWRLLAALSYQESRLNFRAISPVGARGLMQIMPATARQYGIPCEFLEDPVLNIATAAIYLAFLQQHFSDVTKGEQIFYILAGYNGGYNHIRDAMGLCKKYGGNQYSWGDVAYWVLQLNRIKDPIVKYGKMNGSETVNYVKNVLIYYKYIKYIS